MASDDMNFHPSQYYCKDAKDFVESDIRMERLVTSLSGGLAEVQQQGYHGRLVQLIHKSVNDFLISDGFRFLFAIASEPFPQGLDRSVGLSTNEMIGKSQDRLLRSCLNYLKLGEIQVKDNRLLHKRIEEEIFPFVRYATTFLFAHAENAESYGTLQYDLVQHLEGSEQLFKKWVQIYKDIDRYSDECPVERTTLLHIVSSSNLQSTVLTILQNGTDIEEQDSSGNRAIHYTARRGHEKLTSTLLENGAEAGPKNKTGSTPLIQAAGHGHGGVVKLLLERDASISENSLTSGNALQAASFHGHETVVRLLIDRDADVNAQGGNYGNALQAACLHGHELVVQLLIDRGAEVNAQRGQYGNALQAACYYDDEAVVRLLIDRGAEINAQGGYYGNTLQAACFRGNKAVVRLLIDRGAEVITQGGYYGNALQAACFHGDEVVVRLLIDQRANIN